MAEPVVGDRIGRGAMGVVYRAWNEGLQRDVAVKYIRAELMEDEEVIRRFLLEATLIARVDHQNVVRIYDTGTSHDGRPYIVMEYLEGESLKDRLKRGAIPEKEALEIARQVLSGLDEAHKQGIVHRDIKPANIYLTKSGRVKVLDFGVAKAMGSATMTSVGGLIGTAEYMSPEQSEGKPTDARTDLYSLGLVLFEMLTGKTPFTAEVVASILLMQIKDPLPQLPGSITQATRLWVTKLTQKLPVNRFESAEKALRVIPSGDAAANSITDSEEVKKPTPSPPSPIFTSQSVAILLVIIGLITIGVTLNNRRIAENKRQAAIMAEILHKQKIHEAEVAAQLQIEKDRQDKLTRDRAFPDRATVYGVDVKVPTLYSHINHTSIGAHATEFDIYFAITNNLYSEEDHTVEYSIDLTQPTSAKRTYRYTVPFYKNDETKIIYKQWVVDPGLTLYDGTYYYSIYKRGTFIGSGSFTKP